MKSILQMAEDLEEKYPGITEYTLSGFSVGWKEVKREGGFVDYEVEGNHRYEAVSIIDTEVPGGDPFKDDPEAIPYPTLFQERYRGYRFT